MCLVIVLRFFVGEGEVEARPGRTGPRRADGWGTIRPTWNLEHAWGDVAQIFFRAGGPMPSGGAGLSRIGPEDDDV